MTFNKKEWNKNDIKEFNKYLESIQKPDKIEFSRRVVNTKMNKPITTITIPASVILS